MELYHPTASHGPFPNLNMLEEIGKLFFNNALASNILLNGGVHYCSKSKFIVSYFNMISIY